MKTVRFLMLLFGLLVFASFTDNQSDIFLIQTHQPVCRNVSIQPFINVYKQDRTIEVRFLQKVGNVNVQIVTSYGDIIWNQIYATSNTTSTFIDLSLVETVEDASYVITIIAYEEVLEGKFHL